MRTPFPRDVSATMFVVASSAGVRPGVNFPFLSVQITVQSTKRICRESEYTLLACSICLSNFYFVITL